MSAEIKSLANGGELNQNSWDDFVKRLRHDCVGAGANEHCTADALFVVQAKRIISGIDRDFTDNWVVICGDSQWFSPQAYWDDADEDSRIYLDQAAKASYDGKFLDIDAHHQWSILKDLDDHTVAGFDETWEYVNSHFTKEAAEAFIQRKKHDYRNGLRIYVDGQSYCWEFNAVKDAILSGKIGLL